MIRKPKWDVYLLDYFSSIRERPLVWGEHDCCLCVADAVLAMTDIDIAKDFRGTYYDRRTALLRIEQLTAQRDLLSFAEFMASRHGLPSVPRLMAMRGDIAFAFGELGPTIGIVLGKDVYGPGEQQLEKWPVRQAFQVWRV